MLSSVQFQDFDLNAELRFMKYGRFTYKCGKDKNNYRSVYA